MKDEDKLIFKLGELQQFADVIAIKSKKPILATAVKQIETMKERLEFRLKKIVLQCKLDEADAKIEVYKEVVKKMESLT